MHSPDLETAEKIVLAEMGWDPEKAGSHYYIYRKMCNAVVAGIHSERERCAVIARHYQGDDHDGGFDVGDVLLEGPPPKEQP